MWETKDDMTAGEASGYLKEQIVKLAATFAGSPIKEHYEIVLQI